MTEVNRMRQENVDSAVELIQKRSVVQSLLELYKNNKKCRLFTGGCVVAWSKRSWSYLFAHLNMFLNCSTAFDTIQSREQLTTDCITMVFLARTFSASTRILFASLEIDSGLCIQNHTVRKIINCPRRLLILKSILR